MPHLMGRVEVADFDAWLRTHLENSRNREVFGMVDGPIYRDIKDPNAVLVHIFVENMVRAGQWFQSEPFKETDRRYTTVCRDFYWRSSRKADPGARRAGPRRPP